MLKKLFLMAWLWPALCLAQANADWLKQPVSYSTENLNLAEWLEYLSAKTPFDYAYNPAMVDSRKKATLPQFTNLEEAFTAISVAFSVDISLKPGKSLLLKPAQPAPGKVPAKSKLTGKVSDQKTKRPIQEAGVYLSATGNYTKTDYKGAFSFSVPFPSLQSDLIVLAEGYAPIKKSVNLKGNTFLNTMLVQDSLPVKVPNLQSKTFIATSSSRQSPILPIFLAEPEPDSGIVAKLDTGKLLPKVYEEIPFSFSLWPGVSSGRWIPTANIPNLSVNLFAGSNAGLLGAEFGIVANVIQTNMTGFQASGMINVVGGKVTGFSASGLAGYAGLGVKGMQSSGLVSINQGNLKGFQAAGFYNSTRDEVRGMQAAGFANLAHGLNGVQAAGITNLLAGQGNGLQIAGFANLILNQSKVDFVKMSIDSLFATGTERHQVSQIAGFINVSPFDIRGVQIAGFSNWTSGKLQGVQVGGGFNHARQVQGVQIGLVNHTRKLKGLQIGLINLTDTSKGFAIGLINISRNGITELDLEYTDNHIASLKLSSYKKAIHWVYVGSVSPFDSSVKVWAGMGLGTMFGLTRNKDLLDFSFTALNRVPLAEMKELQTWISAEAALNLRLVGGLRLKAGAEINYFMHIGNASGDQLFIPERRPNNFTSTSISVSWINYKVGLGWRF